MLQFNARLERSLTSVALRDTDSQATELPFQPSEQAGRIVALLPPLEPGVYTVAYRVFATDGHIAEGEIRFTVLE